MSFSGGWPRLAFVTGAGSGIGAAIAKRLVGQGLSVVVADIRAEAAEAVCQELGSSATPLAVDVSDEQAVAAAIAEVPGEIELLVNAAGTIGATAAVPETDLETWEQVFAVNVRGTFLTSKYVIPSMRAAGGGVIVNIASGSGLVATPKRAAYCASKGAVIALTRAMALDHVSEGLRVNCVCPGPINSPWMQRLISESGRSAEDIAAPIPMRRLGTPDEVAGAVAYLASPDAAYVSGSSLVIDGGFTVA